MNQARHIYFDGYDIGFVSGVLIERVDDFNMPERDVVSEKVAQADRSAMISADYTGKDVVIEGYIVASSRESLEQTQDTLKLYVQGKEKKLEFMKAGTLRRYYATAVSFIFSEVKGRYCAFTLTFKCSNGLAEDAAETSLSFTNPVTASSSIQAQTFGGVMPVRPAITVTVGAVSGGSSKYIRISNSDTGVGITVLRTWIATDVLVVDSANYSVKVNGVEIDFTGIWPEFSPGAGNIKYEDNFTTSRSVTLAGTYKKKYL